MKDWQTTFRSSFQDVYKRQVSRHVVNYRVLDQIASRTSLVIDFGGGIKTDEDLVIAFDNGAQMVTLGLSLIHI